MALTGFVIMAVAFLPACAVAFFVSCAAFMFAGSGGGGPSSSLPSNSFESGLAVGAVGMLIVAVLLISLMYLLFRSYHRSTLPPESRHAR